MKYLGAHIVEGNHKKYEELERKSLEIEIPEHAHKLVLKLILDEKKKIRYQNNMRYFRKIAKVCAIILVLITISSAILITTVDAFKYKFHDLITIIQKDVLRLIPNEETQEREIAGYWYPEYLPDGFVMDRRIQKEDVKILVFLNASDNIIKIYQQPAEGSSLYLDDKNVQGVTVKNNYEGYVTVNENGIFLYWLQNDQWFNISADMDLEDILKIAESMAYRK